MIEQLAAECAGAGSMSVPAHCASTSEEVGIGILLLILWGMIGARWIEHNT